MLAAVRKRAQKMVRFVGTWGVDGLGCDHGVSLECGHLSGSLSLYFHPCTVVARAGILDEAMRCWLDAIPHIALIYAPYW